MYKKHGESVDHILLHCEITKALWGGVFSGVGLAWVISLRLVDLLACFIFQNAVVYMILYLSLPGTKASLAGTD